MADDPYKDNADGSPVEHQSYGWYFGIWFTAVVASALIGYFF
jgi:hypothetical protein